MLRGLYRFHCRFETDAVLPAFKGSVFRGMFGRCLRQVVCALKRQDCAGCILKQRCLYAQVFETAVTVSPAGLFRQNAVPHPFVIESPEDSRNHLPAGSPFAFNLMLFGPVNHSLPYFVYAIEQMGREGIGRPINDQRGRFAVERVDLDGQAIYQAADGRLRTDLELETLALLPPVLPNGCSQATITLKTPLRLKFDSRLTAYVPFHVLARAMLRRASSLLACYGQGEPALDYKGLVARADLVRTASSRLGWLDVKRFSGRQDREMLMGGMIGTATYRGDLAEFVPLLEFCEKVHIGKQTAFGLGQIRVETGP